MIQFIKKHVTGIALVVLLGITASLIGSHTASANPSYVATTVQTATATTSPAFVTTGGATSVLVYDSYAPTTTINQFKSDQAVLLVQTTGSSTSSILGIALQYSNDGIDWYGDALIDPNGRSTTTAALNLTTLNSMTFNGQTSLQFRAALIPTPTRFVRATFSATGANSSVWAQIAPIKELK